MKSKTLAILLLLITCNSYLFAQLKGIYTVNPAASASATNYKDILSAVQDLDSGKRSDGYKANGPGISSAVTIEIEDGIYYTHLHLSAVSGTSAVNTLSFTSKSKDSSKVVLADSTFGYVLFLENTGYTTFKNLSFIQMGSHKLEAIEMGQNLGNITLAHNQVIGYNRVRHVSLYGASDFTDAALIYMVEWTLNGSSNYTLVTKDSLISITNNLIRGGFNGISVGNGAGYGSYMKRISITNNLIDSFAGTGIEDDADSTYIIGNEISNSFDKRLQAIGGDSSAAISLGAQNTNVFQNKIYMPKGNGIIDSRSVNINIANNFISAGGHGVGVFLYGGDGVSFVYNNVLMLDGDTASCSSNAFAIMWEDDGGGKYNSVVITNNNFVNATPYGRIVFGTPYWGSIFYSYPTFCDYNNYYSSNPAKAFNNFQPVKACRSYFNLSNYSKMTGFDIHSTFLNPGYKSASDLHVSNTKLYGKGNPDINYYTYYVSTDIDGNKRPSVNRPTIGADELPDTTPHVFCSIGTPSLNTPNIVCLGVPTQFADSSKVVNCGKISRTWNFNDGSPKDTSANPVHVCNWLGYRNIVLHVYTSGGCEDSEVYQVFSDSTCTWPGDVDRNKKVDINDVLKLATLIGKTGNKRQKATMNWDAQFCYDWPYFYTNGTSDNYKQFDCNGDGTVDSLDLKAISLNFSKSHLKTDAIETGDSTLDRKLHFVFSKTSYKTGDTLKADIVLDGYKDSMQNYIAGIGAVFGYNPEYIDSNSFKLNFNKSWLDTAGPRMIGFVHTDFSSGNLYFVNTRIDYSQRTGHGKIGEMSFVIPESAKTGYLKLTGINSSISNGSQHMAYLQSDSVKIISNSGINENNTHENIFKVFPNPTHNTVSIISNNTGKFSYSLMDINGKILVSGFMENNGNINLSPFPQAVYVLKINGSNEVFVTLIEKY